MIKTLANKTVLLVDDEQDLLDILREEFSAYGARVQTASTGAEARKALQEMAFDLLITDQLMPGLQGMELAKEVRDGAKTPPVIILLTGAEVEDSAENLGFFAIVPKPFDVERLLSCCVMGLKGRKDS